MAIQDDITKLENEQHRLQLRLGELQDEIQRLKLSQAGLQIGGIVLGTGKRSDRRYQIAKVEFAYHSKPWIYAYPQKKDGSFSVRRELIFDDWTQQ